MDGVLQVVSSAQCHVGTYVRSRARKVVKLTIYRSNVILILQTC